MHKADLGALIDALGVATDVRKLLVALVGLIATCLPGAFFLSLASQPGGGGWLVVLLAIVWLWVGLSLTYGVVVRMSYTELATGSVVPWRAALGYVLGHLDGFLLGPLLFGIGMLLLLALEIAVLFLGRIPYLGELLASVLFLPILALNFGVALAGLFGSWLLFPIVAAEGAGAALAPWRVVELVRRYPGRLIMYGIMALVLGSVATTLMYFLFLASLLITVVVSGIGLGPEKMGQIMNLGPLGGLVPGGALIPLLRFQRPPVTIEIARYIFLLGLAGFLVLVYVFPIVYLEALSCAVYLELSNRTDAAV